MLSHQRTVIMTIAAQHHIAFEHTKSGGNINDESILTISPHKQQHAPESLLGTALDRQLRR